MMHRLHRIEFLTLTLVIAAAAAGHLLGVFRPMGVALGGGAAVLDFFILRRLAAAALLRGGSIKRIVPLALAKSLVLVAIPALALLLPTGLVDGISFAIGVSALPSAIVAEVLLPAPLAPAAGES